MLRTLFLQPPNQSLPLYHTAVKDTKFTYLPTDRPTFLPRSPTEVENLSSGMACRRRQASSPLRLWRPRHSRSAGRSPPPSFLPSFLSCFFLLWEGHSTVQRSLLLTRLYPPSLSGSLVRTSVFTPPPPRPSKGRRSGQERRLATSPTYSTKAAGQGCTAGTGDPDYEDKTPRTPDFW